MVDSDSAFMMGVAASVVACGAANVFRRYREWSQRWTDRTVLGPRPEPRTREERAHALAFATLYEKCGDRVYTHFVAPEDHSRLRVIVREYLWENRDKLSTVYIGEHICWGSVSDSADMIVKKAEEVFLQI